MNQIRTFIKKIKNNTPIDVGLFKKCITDLNISLGENDIEYQKIKPNQYIVTNLNESLRAKLEALTSDDRNRSALASQNKSHASKVSRSFIIAKKHHSDPVTIIFDSNQSRLSEWGQSDFCLIIENRENFLKSDETIRFINAHTDYEIPEDIDILFAEGNAITNSYHHAFLNDYKHIYLFLDLDLGGLKIAQNIINALSKPEYAQSVIHFIMPNDIEQRLAKVAQEITSEDYLNKIDDIGMKVPILKRFSDLISSTRKTLEQDGFLL